MLFILSIFFLVLKILSFILFLLSYNGPAFKIVLIMILIEILYLLTTIGLAKFLKLSELRKDRHNYISRYQIASISDHIWNIGYIIYYISIFIGLIIWLRFNNVNHAFNIKSQLTTIITYIFSNSVYENFLVIVIIVLFIVTYLYFFYRCTKQFGYEIIRLHLYLNFFAQYHKIFFTPGLLDLRKYSFLYVFTFLFSHNFIINYLYNRFYKYYRFIFPKLHNLLKNLHYVVLFLILMHDFIFSNLIISHYFYFLPYFFLYAFWIKFSNAITYRSYIMDHNLSQMLYGKIIIQDGEIFVDGIFICTLESLSEYIKYLNNGLFNLELQRMDNESKGFIIKFIDKIISKVFSMIVIQKLLNYNYRAQLIKIHRINVKIVKIVMILIVICTIVV